ncbi:MAG: condensation domain-containing protein, partial [Acidobacteria bacterium]|nr:condensation domain-containing protein [Acidobacteriota bacterium]
MQNRTIEGLLLSPQQKHLCSISKIEQSVIYRAQCVLTLEGKIETELLQRALQKIVTRHEIFRTTFRRPPGLKIPLQVISDQGSFLFREIVFSCSNPETVENRLMEICLSERNNIFDLDHGPVMRTAFLTLSENLHFLIITLPALCADSSTLMNLTQEVCRFYQAEIEGDEISDEIVQYAEFSEWQNELISGGEAEIGKNYWCKQDLLHHLPPKLS